MNDTKTISVSNVDKQTYLKFAGYCKVNGINIGLALSQVLAKFLLEQSNAKKN